MNMKISCIYTRYESYYVESIAEVLKKNGHIVNLLFDPQTYDNQSLKCRLRKLINNKKMILKHLEYIEKQCPEILLFYIMPNNIQWVRQYAKEVKSHFPQIHILFVGQYITTGAKEILSNWYVDFIIQKEDECCILDFIQAIENNISYKDILNIGYKEGNNVVINGMGR